MALGRCLNNLDVNQFYVFFFFWVFDEGIVKKMMEKNKGRKKMNYKIKLGVDDPLIDLIDLQNPMVLYFKKRSSGLN